MFSGVCGISIDLYDCDYCWDIHTVWRSFPNDTLPATGSIFIVVLLLPSTVHTAYNVVYFFLFLLHDISLFHSILYRAVALCWLYNVAHTNAIQTRRCCGQSMLGKSYLLNTCLMPWFFQAQRAAYVCLCMCMRGVLYILVLVYFSPYSQYSLCGLLCFSLSILYAIMCQAPTID